MGVNEWQHLGPRTKSNELSTMTNLVSNFGNPITNGHIFEGKNKTRLDVGELVCTGKIVVASFDGISNRQSASAICKLLKSDVYGSIQARQNPSCGYCIAEIPLTGKATSTISWTNRFPKERNANYLRLKRKTLRTSMSARQCHNPTRLFGLRTSRESRVPRNPIPHRPNLLATHRIPPHPMAN